MVRALDCGSRSHGFESHRWDTLFILRVAIPRKIKGFRDIAPTLNQLRWEVIQAVSSLYQNHGFEHWDTPLVEYAEVLGKHLPDKDTPEEGVYAFPNPEKEPQLGADGEALRHEWNNEVMMQHHFLSLRYDLTAPLARKYAEDCWQGFRNKTLNENNVPLFRRYQFGAVFRFETKVEAGRFREFWQLDFDTVGTKDMAADAEACMLLSEAIENVGICREDYQVKVNNRKILTGMLNSLGISGEKEQHVLRVIDKADKIGLEELAKELGTGRVDPSGATVHGVGLDVKTVREIVAFLNAFEEEETRQETLSILKKKVNNEVALEGIAELNEIDRSLTAMGVAEDRVCFDPTLVRGLAYYTGPVFEVESKQISMGADGKEHKVGAIAAGGRYNNLVKRLLGIEAPATGASIGIDRLCDMLQLTRQKQALATAPVLIPVFNTEQMTAYQILANRLRKAGIPCEVYYGIQKGLRKQLAYADKKHCPIALLLGEDEMKKGVATVKNLRKGRELSNIKDKSEWKASVQEEVALENLPEHLRKLLFS